MARKKREVKLERVSTGIVNKDMETLKKSDEVTVESKPVVDLRASDMVAIGEHKIRPVDNVQTLVVEAKLTGISKIIDEIYKFWDTIPSPIQIVIYVLVSALINALIAELQVFEVQSPILSDLKLAIINAFVYLGQELGRRRLELIKTQAFTNIG